MSCVSFFNFFLGVHGAMGCCQKCFMRCHQLLSGFPANGNLPECYVSHVSRPILSVVMRWNRELCTHLLTYTLWLRKTPETSAKRPFDEDCASSDRLNWGPLPQMAGSHLQSWTEEKGKKEAVTHLSFFYSFFMLYASQFFYLMCLFMSSHFKT